MLGQISRDEIRSAIADKLSAHFSVSPDHAIPFIVAVPLSPSKIT